MNPVNGENPFSFSPGKPVEGNRTLTGYPEVMTVEPVNNYFKSMKEIEEEFLTSMNTARTSLKNMLDELGSFGQNLIYMDGEINFPDPYDIHQGYMEENY
jgi:hypothetical protein